VQAIARRGKAQATNLTQAKMNALNSMLINVRKRALWIAPIRRAHFRYNLQKTPACCFLWIPKTAGTAVFEWLADEIGMLKMRDLRDFRAFPNTGAVTFGHVHYLSLRANRQVNDTYHNNSLRFTVVRNPYERVVSLYGYVQKHRTYTSDFATFLEQLELERTPVGLYNVAGLSQGNPQLNWLTDTDGGLLPHHVFHQENLDEIEDVLPNLLGWTPRTRLGRKNVGKKTSIDELLAGNTKHLETINRIYRADFKRLGYPMIPA